MRDYESSANDLNEDLILAVAWRHEDIRTRTSRRKNGNRAEIVVPEWLEHALDSPDRVEVHEKDPALEHRFVIIPAFGPQVQRGIINTEAMPLRVVKA